MLTQPFHIPHLRDAKAFYRYLDSCQAAADRQTILSVALPLPAVDPLAVLAQVAEQAHFYWEIPEEETAIVAVSPLTALNVTGGDRFEQAQSFIDDTLPQILAVGNMALPYAGPHFFCSFTFFERAEREDSLFPPAQVYLPQWHVARRGETGVLVANLPLAHPVKLATQSDELWRLWQQLQQLRPFAAQSPVPHYRMVTPPPQRVQAFLNRVQSTLDIIDKGILDKLVLAEVLEAQTTEAVDLPTVLARLRSRYTSCQIFSLQDTRGLQFIGASPERLLHITDGQLTTDVLAGSAPRGQTSHADRWLGHQLINSAKDQHEHRIVLRFIQEQLQHLGLRPRATAPPQLLRLPNIQHLQTLIQAQLPPSLEPLAVLSALHPTPAVAGTPRHVAEAHLHRYELFNRQLYAAPLGWVDYRQNGHFTVGIRSALIQDRRLQLYAGAGIVAGSDPKKEWAEVRLKLQTLLQALVADETPTWIHNGLQSSAG